MSRTPFIVGVSGTSLTSSEYSLLKQLQPAGYVLFSRNIESCDQVRALTDSLYKLSEVAPIISIDQEGGRVVRTKALGVEMPSAYDLSTKGNSEDIIEQARLTSLLLSQLGFNLNLAPVLDVGVYDGRSNALSSRCWGASVQEVISHTGVYNAAMKRYGMATCGKHFPGLGKACVDAHFELPVIPLSKDEMMKEDLLPFLNVDKKVMPAMMVAHIDLPEWDSDYPSSLSNVVIQKTLRDQFAYEGFVLTDDLDMQAIKGHYGLKEAACLALEAGNDLAMICHSLDELEEIAFDLKNLPRPLLSDIDDRLDDFADQFSSKRYAYDPSLCQRWVDQSKHFFEEFGSPEQEGIPASPVQGY